MRRSRPLVIAICWGLNYDCHNPVLSATSIRIKEVEITLYFEEITLIFHQVIVSIIIDMKWFGSFLFHLIHPLIITKSRCFPITNIVFLFASSNLSISIVFLLHCKQYLCCKNFFYLHSLHPHPKVKIPTKPVMLAHI